MFEPVFALQPFHLIAICCAVVAFLLGLKIWIDLRRASLGTLTLKLDKKAYRLGDRINAVVRVNTKRAIQVTGVEMRLDASEIKLTGAGEMETTDLLSRKQTADAQAMLAAGTSKDFRIRIELPSKQLHQADEQKLIRALADHATTTWYLHITLRCEGLDLHCSERLVMINLST